MTTRSNGSKSNVEIEGLLVPDGKIILDLIKRYKDRLDEESFFEFLKILEQEASNIEELEVSEDENRKAFR